MGRMAEYATTRQTMWIATRRSFDKPRIGAPPPNLSIDANNRCIPIGVNEATFFRVPIVCLFGARLTAAGCRRSILH